jgi:hypothetical protein
MALTSRKDDLKRNHMADKPLTPQERQALGHYITKQWDVGRGPHFEPSEIKIAVEAIKAALEICPQCGGGL